MKRTPLFAAHQKLGGKLIEFGGWEMPVQYTSITDEHLTVRKAAGIFDISHMGEVSVKGTAAEEFLNHYLTNDIRKLEVGQGQYTLMCNERGGVMDDLYAYRLEAEEYLLIINASRIDDDVAWLKKQWTIFARKSEVALQDVSASMGAVAVQGPRVVEFIRLVFAGGSEAGTRAPEVTELKKNQAGRWPWNAGGRNISIWVARTGYTGEDGFEIVAPAEAIESVWEKVLAAGSGHGLKPAGLGARDTLRTEVCYPLYGHELDQDTTPIEAGLGFFVALEKGEFVGRKVLAKQKAEGTSRKLVAFKMTEKSAPPRPTYPIWSSGETGAQIGSVASGTQSPSLGIGIGMGYVPIEFAKPETPIQIEIRGKGTARWWPGSLSIKRLIDRERTPCLNERMANVPSDLKYAKSHEWVRIAGEIATVGITDHAQHELTDVVFVELPEAGRKLKSGESCAVVESVKTASDIYSPLSGEVTETNKTVADNPALVNSEPYAGGWFFKLKLSNPAETGSLLSPDDYQKQIGGS